MLGCPFSETTLDTFRATSLSCATSLKKRSNAIESKELSCERSVPAVWLGACQRQPIVQNARATRATILIWLKYMLVLAGVKRGCALSGAALYGIAEWPLLGFRSRGLAPSRAAFTDVSGRCKTVRAVKRAFLPLGPPGRPGKGADSGTCPQTPLVIPFTRGKLSSGTDFQFSVGTLST